MSKLINLMAYRDSVDNQVHTRVRGIDLKNPDAARTYPEITEAENYLKDLVKRKGYPSATLIINDSGEKNGN
jgi:hypothetical protein